jgi:uncharacterized protein (DUF1501 family)
MISRRRFLQASGAALSLYHLPVHARTQSNKRFVWVMLRGAMDGISALVPYGDPNYEKLRGNLAIPAPAGIDTGLKLDGFFALHPSLPTFADLFAEGQLIAFPSVASAYRERSHFDGQNLMENGGIRPYGQRDGWLNRALQLMDGGRGLAVGPSVPTVMQGDLEVESWSPSVLPSPDEDIYLRLGDLYSNDELLSGKLDSLMRTREEVMSMGMDGGDMEGGGRSNGLRAFTTMVDAATKLLSADNGPQVATLELGGWDTHSGQGNVNGRLANQLRGLNNGIEALKNGLGDKWTDTTLVVMTEFGRTMKTNGTGGTDHGTGSAAFVAGGAINGGRVVGDWPGLAERDLYEGRDLRPTLDNRAILKALLAEQFDLNEAQLAELVFPNSKEVDILQGLI